MVIYQMVRYIFAGNKSCMRHSHMMWAKPLFSLLVTLSCVSYGHAQTHCVIVDKETGTPIRNVKVFTDKGQVAVTDYQGRVSVETPFESATISHVSYLQRRVSRFELRDTLWLLPKENRLGEVVVWGKDRKNLVSMVVKSAVADAPMYAPPKGIAEFDFFKMFEKKPLNRKARKKNKQILEGWDQIYEMQPDSVK